MVLAWRCHCSPGPRIWPRERAWQVRPWPVGGTHHRARPWLRGRDLPSQTWEQCFANIVNTNRGYKIYYLLVLLWRQYIKWGTMSPNLIFKGFNVWQYCKYSQKVLHLLFTCSTMKTISNRAQRLQISFSKAKMFIALLHRNLWFPWQKLWDD